MSQQIARSGALLEPECVPQYKLTSVSAKRAFVAVEEALWKHVGRGRRQAILVAVSDPALAAIALYRLPKSFAVAPAPWTLSLHESAAVLERIDPILLVTDRRDSVLARTAAIRGVDIAVLSAHHAPESAAPNGRISIQQGSRRASDARRYPRGTAIILQTSGTTGAPKIVALTRTNMAQAIGSVIDSLGLGPDDRTLAAMPLTHIHGLVAVLHAGLDAGGTLLAIAQLDPAAFWRAAPAFRPTWFSVVPTLLGALCDAAPNGPAEGLAGLRFVRTASSELPAPLRARAEALFKVPVLEAYGMTEACHQVASNTLAAHRPGSVGRVGAHPNLSIRTATGAPAPAGEAGEICIRGRNMFAGYVEIDPRPRRWWTPARDRNATHWGRWFRTGDLGRIDPDGYLRIVGRLKEQINRGGETLSPAEIEEALLSLSAVRAAAVFALPHPALGEEVAAVCVPVRREAASESELISEASKLLSFAKLPKRIFFVDALPASGSGKISRRILAERYAAQDPFGASRKAAPSAIKDSMRARSPDLGAPDGAGSVIARIIRDELALDALDPDASFFALGGTSLQAARIFVAIKRDCGVDLPIATIVTHPSASALSRAVASAGASADGEASPASPVKRGATPLPASLADFCIAQTLDPTRDDLRQSFVVEFAFPVLPEDLADALTEMAGRHAALRCAVQQVDDETFAFVETGAQRSPLIVLEGEVVRWTESAGLRVFLRDPLPLDAAPLLRVAAQALTGGRHVYGFKISELILDGYARMTFLAELGGLLSGHPPTAHDDRFGTLLERVRPASASPAAPAASGETFHPPGDLAGARASGALQVVRLRDRAWWDGVEALARRCGATPFATTLSLFAAVLDRLAGGPVEILLSVQRRSAADDYRTIGNFVDRIATCVAIGAGDSFADVARRTTATLLGAVERARHHSIAFGERVVMFEIEDELDALTRLGEGPGATIIDRLGAMTIAPVAPTSATSALALAVSPNGAYGRPGPAKVSLTYDAALYSAGRADAILDAVLNLLDRAIADPHQIVVATPLTAAGAPNPHAAEAAPAAVPTPVPAGAARLDDLFAAAAARTPDADALTFPGGALSFSAIDAAAKSVAAKLRSIGGVAGRLVAFWDAPHPQADGHDIAAGWSPLYAIGGLAVLQSDGVVLPIGKAAPSAQIAAMAVNAGVGLMATGASGLPDEMAALFESAGAVETPCGPLRLFRSRTAPAPTPIAAGAAYLMHSSGTTGTPKGILQSHRAMIELVEAALATGVWPAGNVMPGHDIGFDVFSAAVWLSWAAGRAVHSPRVFDYSPAALAELREAGVTSFMTSPTVAAALAAHDPACLSGFALIVLTGEELPLSVAKRLLGLPGDTQFVNFYGPTETTVWASFEPIVAPAGPRVAIGKALKGYRLEVADPTTLAPMPVDLPGEILIGAPSAPLGYLANDAANRRAFIERPGAGGARTFYRSGDIGWIDRSGRLHYAGRRDRQIQMSGIRVELGGVETVLAEVDGVSQAAVVDVPTPSGPYLAAFLVPTSAGVDADALARSATETAQRRLPASSVPHAVSVIARLPASRSGKVDFAALRRQALEARLTAGTKHAIAAGTIEADIAAIWSDLLERSDFHLDDEFQKSGGTSLGMMRLATRLRAAFDVQIAVGELFFTRSIAAQGDLVRSRTQAAPALRARPPQGATLLEISGPARDARSDRPWLVGLPLAGGTTSALGLLGELFRERYDVSLIEATAAGRRRFQQRGWLEVAEETCRMLEERMRPGAPPPILCGFSLGGWLAWLTERVFTARNGACGLRVVNIDSGALHLNRPEHYAPDLHAAIAQAEAIGPSEMLLVSRRNENVPFVRPNLWPRLGGGIVRTPPARTLLHAEMKESPVLDAAVPFVERWIAGDRGEGWPAELPVERTTAGRRLFDAFEDGASVSDEDYAALKCDFLSRTSFAEGALVFEMLAVKVGDTQTAFEMARRHYAASPKSRYAAFKQMMIWRLRGESGKLNHLASTWLDRHPNDHLVDDMLSGKLSPHQRARPRTKVEADYNWWLYFLGAAGQRRA